MLDIKMSWNNPKLREGKSLVEGGKGVFALKKIKKGEVLTIYGGYIMKIEDVEKLPRELREFPYHISDDLLFGPIEKKDVGIGECYNHSCSPNAGFKDSMTLVAMNDIAKDEEITFDYATCMTSYILDLKCMCGKKSCRKIIKGSDWKMPRLQKKYKGYFLPYIEDKIKKMKNKNK